MRTAGPIGGLLCTCVVLAACGNSGQGTETLADGGTFTVAVPEDPGNLDPLLASSGLTRRVDRFLYDTLVYLRPDGQVASGLATKWEAGPTAVTYTLNKGVTCADGSPLTASDVAATYAFIAEPSNGSPLLGIAVTPGTTAKADDAANTVTITAPAPDPFLTRKATSVFVVCRKGLSDPTARQRGEHGTGLFKLTEMVAEDHYTMVRRPDYAWGPDGVTGREKGMPDTTVVKVVKNETTATNLLLSGQVNVIDVTGPERSRLDAAGTFKREDHALLGAVVFNQADRHPGQDERVRRALVSALDIAELARVMGGRVPKSLVAQDPKACPGETVAANAPGHDDGRAGQLLDEAGWAKGADGNRSKDGQRLTLRVVYLPAYGEGTVPTAELVAQKWRQLGAAVEITGLSPTQSKEVLYQTGAWDVSLIPINTSLPSQLAAFVSGAVPPNGNNYAHIDNPRYRELIAEASAVTGDASCAKWLAAETELIKRADMVPFAEEATPSYGRGVRFDLISGGIAPSSIRLVAG